MKIGLILTNKTVDVGNIKKSLIVCTHKFKVLLILTSWAIKTYQLFGSIVLRRNSHVWRFNSLPWCLNKKQVCFISWSFENSFYTLVQTFTVKDRYFKPEYKLIEKYLHLHIFKKSGKFRFKRNVLLNLGPDDFRINTPVNMIECVWIENGCISYLLNKKLL